MTINRGHRKQRKNLLQHLIRITIVTVSATVLLLIANIYINWRTEKTQQYIEVLSKEIVTIEEQIEEAKTKQEEYKEQMNQLQMQISRYQPVIIPDSMKDN